jgi:hypothetical protein
LLKTFLLTSLMVVLFATSTRAEVQISNVTLTENSLDEHWVHGEILNNSPEVREVTFRTQVIFYERNSPRGDLPLNVLRKDQTIILKAQEKRLVDVKFIEQGGRPLLPIRAEPLMRVRREREWKY